MQIKEMIFKIINLVALLLSIAWLARSPDWEPAITSLTLFAALIAQEIRGPKVLPKKRKDKTLNAESQIAKDQYVNIINALRGFIDDYYKVQQNIIHIEDKTAYIIINAKYIKSLRNSTHHLMRGLQQSLDSMPNSNIRKEFEKAREHINQIDLNGYELLSGFSLAELREKIEKSGLLTKTGKSIYMHDKAKEYFSLAREIRSEDKIKAMEYFEECIDYCQKGTHEIGPIKKLFRK